MAPYVATCTVKAGDGAEASFSFYNETTDVGPFDLLVKKEGLQKLHGICGDSRQVFEIKPKKKVNAVCFVKTRVDK